MAASRPGPPSPARANGAANRPIKMTRASARAARTRGRPIRLDALSANRSAIVGSSRCGRARRRGGNGRLSGDRTVRMVQIGAPTSPTPPRPICISFACIRPGSGASKRTQAWPPAAAAIIVFRGARRVVRAQAARAGRDAALRRHRFRPPGPRGKSTAFQNGEASDHGPTAISLPTNTGGPDGLPSGEPPGGSTVTA